MRQQRKLKLIGITLSFLIVMFSSFYSEVEAKENTDNTSDINEIIQENVDGEVIYDSDISNEIEELNSGQRKELKENLEAKDSLTNEEEAILEYINEHYEVNMPFPFDKTGYILFLLLLIVGGVVTFISEKKKTKVIISQIIISGLVVTFLYAFIYGMTKIWSNI